MSTDEDKLKTALTWIASVAGAVLCCSTIFIVFASYLDEIKSDIRENNMRLSTIEKRQDAMFSEFDMITKRLMATMPSMTPPMMPPGAVLQPQMLPPPAGDSNSTPAPTAPSASVSTPATPTPPPAVMHEPTTSPAPASPAVTVPVMPAESAAH